MADVKTDDARDPGPSDGQPVPVGNAIPATGAEPGSAPEHAPHQHTRDILAELEAEVAQEMEEDRPPAGGPIYQIVGASVAIAAGVLGAVLSFGYGLGSLDKPGPGLWPFVVSVLIVVLSVILLVIGRGLTDSEAFTRAVHSRRSARSHSSRSDC